MAGKSHGKENTWLFGAIESPSLIKGYFFCLKNHIYGMPLPSH